MKKKLEGKRAFVLTIFFFYFRLKRSVIFLLYVVLFGAWNKIKGGEYNLNVGNVLV